MLITYIVFLALAIAFKVLHWPGTGILFLASIAFPFIGIIVSAARKNAESVLKYTCVFLIAVFLLFKFLYWPGSALLFIMAAAVTISYIILYGKRWKPYTVSFYAVIVLFLFAAVNYSLPRSSFRLLYLKEDPFNPHDPMPHFFVQSLAYELYHEGKYDQAETLIKRNLDDINELLAQEKIFPEYLREIEEKNLEITYNDLESIRQRKWNKLVPLIREYR